MEDDELKNVDPDDISELLVKVEKSFDIKFGKTELLNISTFGELCDHITDKIQLQHSNDCTSQQAFYKLRNAIASTLRIDHKTISTDFSLIDLLPKQNRRSLVEKLEDNLGFKLHILRPPYWVTVTLAILFVTSCVALFLAGKLVSQELSFRMLPSRCFSPIKLVFFHNFCNIYMYITYHNDQNFCHLIIGKFYLAYIYSFFGYRFLMMSKL